MTGRKRRLARLEAMQGRNGGTIEDAIIALALPTVPEALDVDALGPLPDFVPSPELAAALAKLPLDVADLSGDVAE